MLMPDRKFSATSEYRYGFNSQELDDDINNGYSNFGFRIYDCKIGRWLSVDPLVKKTPFESPFLFVSCNPVVAVDPDGREKIVVTGGGNKHLLTSKMMFVNASKIQLKRYVEQLKKEQNNEQVSWLIYDRDYTQKEKSEMKAWALKNGVSAPIFINKADEVVNYVNRKRAEDPNPNHLESYAINQRLSDPITSLSFMSHGMGGAIALGFENSDNGGFPNHALTSDKIRKIGAYAFNNNSQIELFTCNSATQPGLKPQNISMTEEEATKMAQNPNNGSVLTTLSNTIPQAEISGGLVGQSTYSPVRNGQLPNAATTGGDYSPQINGSNQTPSLKFKAKNGKVTRVTN